MRLSIFILSVILCAKSTLNAQQVLPEVVKSVKGTWKDTVSLKKSYPYKAWVMGLGKMIDDFMHIKAGAAPYRETPAFEVTGIHLAKDEQEIANYPWSHLSTVIFYPYDIDFETGSPLLNTAYTQWHESTLHDSAACTNTSVLLGSRLHGWSDVLAFLENKEALLTWTDSLASWVNTRNAEGVYIDIQPIDEDMQTLWLRAVKILYKRLPEGKKRIYATLPPYMNAPEIENLSYIERLIVLPFNLSPEEAMKPITPLYQENKYWGGLAQNLYNYEHYGKNKILMALPHFGSCWVCKDSLYQKNACFRDGFSPAKDLHAQYRHLVLETEENSQSGFYDVSDWSQYTRCYIDGADHIGAKLDWMIHQKVSGVVIWALGQATTAQRKALKQRVNIGGPYVNVQHPFAEAYIWSNFRPLTVGFVFWWGSALGVLALLLLAHTSVRRQLLGNPSFQMLGSLGVLVVLILLIVNRQHWPSKTVAFLTGVLLTSAVAVASFSFYRRSKQPKP